MVVCKALTNAIEDDLIRCFSLVWLGNLARQRRAFALGYQPSRPQL